ADVFARLPVTVEAQASLDELTQFLTEFYETPLMHQVRRLRVQPVLKEDKIEGFDLSLAAEALSMPDAIAIDRLPSEEEAALALSDIPDRESAEFAVFASKNIFQPTEWVDRSAKSEDKEDAPKD